MGNVWRAYGEGGATDESGIGSELGGGVGSGAGSGVGIGSSSVAGVAGLGVAVDSGTILSSEREVEVPAVKDSPPVVSGTTVNTDSTVEEDVSMVVVAVSIVVEADVVVLSVLSADSKLLALVSGMLISTELLSMGASSIIGTSTAVSIGGRLLGTKSDSLLAPGSASIKNSFGWPGVASGSIQFAEPSGTRANDLSFGASRTYVWESTKTPPDPIVALKRRTVSPPELFNSKSPSPSRYTTKYSWL